MLCQQDSLACSRRGLVRLVFVDQNVYACYKFEFNILGHIILRIRCRFEKCTVLLFLC